MSSTVVSLQHKEPGTSFGPECSARSEFICPSAARRWLGLFDLDCSLRLFLTARLLLLVRVDNLDHFQHHSVCQHESPGLSFPPPASPLPSSPRKTGMKYIHIVWVVWGFFFFLNPFNRVCFWVTKKFWIWTAESFKAPCCRRLQRDL